MYATTTGSAGRPDLPMVISLNHGGPVDRIPEACKVPVCFAIAQASRSPGEAPH